MFKRICRISLLSVLCGCAGMSKSCSQFSAANFGSDWIVVQYGMDGHPFHCWKLRGAAVTQSEGGNIDWKDPKDGHLVHVTGWENRVQVQNGDFQTAAAIVGVDANKCTNGAYSAQ